MPILKANGVTSYLTSEVEISFPVEQSTKPTELSTKDHVVPIDESELPPDLRTDNINSMDTILNWSGTPSDQNELPLPGTEIPLEFPDYEDRRHTLPAEPP